MSQESFFIILRSIEVMNCSTVTQNPICLSISEVFGLQGGGVSGNCGSCCLLSVLAAVSH